MVKPKLPFTPTSEQLRAAEALMVAMAHEGTVRPIVEGYERAFLAEHQFHIAAKFLAVGVPDKVVLEPSRSYLLEAADFAAYLEACEAARVRAGLFITKPGNCPLLEAESDRIACENALLGSWKDHPTLAKLADGLSSRQDLREQAIELTLKLLAPYLPDRAAPMLESVLRDDVPTDEPAPGCAP